MGRLIVLILLIVLAVWLIRRALRSSSLKTQSPQKTVTEDQLVRCAHCGVHLPRAEARQVEGVLYCSEEHARLGKR
jgi:uncharacterized protein